MPIFEEKLISPLALRFTQEHIKTIFRDGHIVEDTVVEIETTASTSSDYDLILIAPFPQIEIIRWGRSDSAGGDGRHWFTLDNRRLYCLQRAAMRLWPQRVAAKVEILYADPGAVRKKYDSTTFGESVTIAASCKDAPLFRWDWRTEKVGGDSDEEAATTTRGAAAAAAFRAAVTLDDARMEVDDLTDAAEASPESTLARMLAFEEAREEEAKLEEAKLVSCEVAQGQVQGRSFGFVRCPTPSTSAASEDSDGQGTPRQAPSGGVSRKPVGRSRVTPVPREGCEDHAARALQEIDAQLRGPGADGRLRLRNWQERFGEHLGSIRRFIEGRPDKYVLVPERQGKFRVVEVAGDDGCAVPAATPVAEGALAAQAVAEVRTQLLRQGGAGHVKLDDWSGRYGESLGTFKAFVRSHSGEFTIVPGQGRCFRLALVR